MAHVMPYLTRHLLRYEIAGQARNDVSAMRLRLLRLDAS